MIARKRYLIVTCLTLAVLTMAGCQSANHQNMFGRNEQTPTARIPLLDPPNRDPLGNPEILPDTHVAAGKLHESQGKLARAAEQYRLAIALKPDYVPAYNRLGIVLDRLRRFKEADDLFDQAIALAPEQAHLRNNLAFSYLMQARWSEAEVEFRRALEIQPEFTRARVNLAITLAQQERFDEAMPQFQMALLLEDAYYNMGLMYQSKRRIVEAACAFKSALKVNPKMVSAEKRLAKLPADVLSAAEEQMATFASPMPVEQDAAEKTNPTTQPASDNSVDEQSELDDIDSWVDSDPMALQYDPSGTEVQTGWE